MSVIKSDTKSKFFTYCYITDQAKRLKELEKENARLKKLVADLSLDNQILKEVTSGEL